MALKRMDNMGSVVESFDTAIAFFAELGIKLEGQAIIEEEWAGRVTGVRGQRVEVVSQQPFDGPIFVRARGTDHAISRDLAARIGVE